MSLRHRAGNILLIAALIAAFSLNGVVRLPIAAAQESQPLAQTAGQASPNQILLPQVMSGAPSSAALAAARRQPTESLSSVIVILKDQVDLKSIPGNDRAEKRRNVVLALRGKANGTQGRLRALLAVREAQGLVASVTPLWIMNAIAVTAADSVIAELAAAPEVERIVPDFSIQGPMDSQSTVEPLPEPNLNVMRATDLWSLGYYGQGVVVGSMDTGVDVNHPDLTAQWRGGSNSWYDPYNEHTTPADLNGHGTQTTGIMVGGSSGGTAIGVAPQAQWIAAKIFDDRNSATAGNIHLAFQWMLDPDGNPNTDDSPDVVNNSWTYGAPGCNLDFQPDLQALRAAEIVPVFAAGNYGPNSSTDVSPANNPEAISVGATDNGDGIASLSSNGPTTCGREAAATYPSVVAPGVNVSTTDLFGFYTQVSGTSLAAPHVSGAFALLLSTNADRMVSQLEDALSFTSIDLGSVGPDNAFGAGRIDVMAAYNYLVNTPPTATALPSPTPSATQLPPTATPTPSPTATSTSTPAATSTPSPTATPTSPVNDVVFADGFESGNVSGWSSRSTNSASRLDVTASAALVGAYGLQAQGSNTNYVQFDFGSASNPATSTLDTRFEFRPNSNNSSGKDIFSAATSSDFSTPIFRVLYRLSGSTPQVQIQVGTSNANGVWTDILGGANNNVIEVLWQAAGSGSPNPGTLTLYVNGALSQTLTTTNSGMVGSFRMGSITRTGNRTTMYFDGFAAKRSVIALFGP